ncbi:acyltransferase family protein [Agromyces sp. MMS24-K17]|uniref:acyltransferase family protein n=1 Tax=Agromyces sp. MMS24-K17 TaxID=3372850 RepID=UPI0037551B83
MSGFLITAHLLREADRTGRISLRTFYLRRARRILPAATAVLVVVSALTLLLVPVRQWTAWFREIVASALYVENWQLLIASQDPATADLRSTPVQHYWSLSVEEQFYLVWPLLIILALWLAARRGTDASRWMLLVLVPVSVASFALSLALTADDHNLAYFSTLARAWEFGAGAILAVVLARRGAAGGLEAAGVPGRRDGLRAAAAWAGLAAVVLPIVLFTDAEAFPGAVVLLPVVGTAVVILVGMPRTAWSPARAMALRPVQWTGDVSYSLYLWHWPVLMFAPYLTGMPSPPWLMVLLVALSFAIAGASKRWIEDPFRRRAGRVPVGRPAVLLGAVSVGMAAVLTAGAIAPGVAAEHRLACEKNREDGPRSDRDR